MNKQDSTELIAAAASQAATTAMQAAKEVGTDIKYIQRDIGEIKSSLKDMSGSFVTVDQFEPVKKIVYGLAYVLGAATLGAILKLVLIP